MKSYDLPKDVAKKAMLAVDNMLYEQHLKGCFDDGDPNHPKYNDGYNYATGKYVSLFGYEEKEFLEKQYK